MDYERIVEMMRELHGVILSEGAVAQIIERAGKTAVPAAETIKVQIIKDPVTKSDEMRPAPVLKATTGGAGPSLAHWASTRQGSFRREALQRSRP